MVSCNYHGMTGSAGPSEHPSLFEDRKLETGCRLRVERGDGWPHGVTRQRGLEHWQHGHETEVHSSFLSRLPQAMPAKPALPSLRSLITFAWVHE